MGINRREFLAGAAGATALAVSGCGPQDQAQDNAPMRNAALKTLRDLGNVRDITFVDSEGNPVNLAGLQSQIGNNHSTLSFMFAACGDTCPITGAALSAVSRNHPNLKHVIVSVDPAGDFKNKRLHDLMALQGLKTSGPDRNTFILYPTVNGKTDDRSLFDGGRNAYQIQNAFELVTHGKEREYHNATVTLFDPRGKMVAQVLEGPQTIVQTLEASLGARGQSR